MNPTESFSVTVWSQIVTWTLEGTMDETALEKVRGDVECVGSLIFSGIF